MYDPKFSSVNGAAAPLMMLWSETARSALEVMLCGEAPPVVRPNTVPSGAAAPVATACSSLGSKIVSWLQGHRTVHGQCVCRAGLGMPRLRAPHLHRALEQVAADRVAVEKLVPAEAAGAGIAFEHALDSLDDLLVR